MGSDVLVHLKVAVCALIATLVPAAIGKYGRTGESNDPYLIYAAEHLNAIGTDPNDWDKHFKLMADIDLSTFDDRDDRARRFVSRPVSGPASQASSMAAVACARMVGEAGP
jgi:hypothetical protein